jgi:UDP-4-amino-4,6-dideoxy-N-acetyl-beta-L-altrosamine transaminase
MASIPYSCQDIDEADIRAVEAVLRSEYLTQGPAVGMFEAGFAQRHQVTHAIAVCNATAGLHIACLALGVGRGTRVWTSPNSFVASANCALYCGATVDFVDIDPRTRNMSVDTLRGKLQRAAREGQLPQVVIPVDFAGVPCDLRETRELADEYGFRILEDASHAAGASYASRPVGCQFADIAVFSFHAVKVMTTGEGGMAVTQDGALAERLRLLRSHGVTRERDVLTGEPEGGWVYEQQALGFNYRMTDIQAALGSSQLARLDLQRRRRAALVERYRRMLDGLPIRLPHCPGDRESSWHLFVVELDDSTPLPSRAQVFARMREAGIGVNVHYIPIHTQPYFAALGFMAGDFPAAERFYRRALTLPLFPAMSDAQQDQVVAALREALR